MRRQKPPRKYRPRSEEPIGSCVVINCCSRLGSSRLWSPIPACGKLNRETNLFFPVAVLLIAIQIWYVNSKIRIRLSRPAPVRSCSTLSRLGHLVLSSFSRFPRRRCIYAIGPVPSLSGPAIVYRRRSPPRVRRHRASGAQGIIASITLGVLPLQVKIHGPINVRPFTFRL